MKYADGKEALRGDAVIFEPTPDTILSGNVHELYDRTLDMRVTGYALRVPAKNAILAKSGWDAFKKLNTPVQSMPPTGIVAPSEISPAPPENQNSGQQQTPPTT